MEINVKLMSEAAYKTLQKNYSEVYKEIINHPSDSSWLKGYLGFEPYETKTYTIEDFELADSDSYDDVKVENAITLYEHLNKLPRYILCNNRFWAWITFEKAYKQAIKQVELKSDSIVKNWWLGGDSRRSLMLGIISRNYFEVEVSVDDQAKDRYYITRFMLNAVDEMYRMLTFRNIGMLKNVSLAYLKVQHDYSEKNNYRIVKPDSRSFIKQVSKLGSVMLIDIMTEKEIYDALYPKFEKIILEKSVIGK